MRALYPGILGTHLLRYLWAFKYDSQLGGVGTHADPSLVTFNYWITQDEANNDPEHGGLTSLGYWGTPRLEVTALYWRHRGVSISRPCRRQGR